MNRLRLINVSFTALVVTWGMFSCDPKEDPIIRIPPAEEGFIEVNGGGSQYTNTVFVNLRKQEQLAIGRKNWDLAFNTGSEFQVLLNGTTGAMAIETAETDINAVGEIQAEQLRNDGTLELTFSNLDGILYVDDTQNPLSDPAISSISANDSENKVYILNRGSSGTEERPWKKIRVLQRDGKYLLQHADIDATTFSTIEITKKQTLNFVYVSFESGEVTIEPDKTNWDFMWTAGTSSTPFPQAVNGTLAYFFQDLVYHNIYGGAEVTQVLEEEIAYDNFNESNLGGLTLNTDNRLTIGANWRSGGGPNAAPAIRDDRYYVLKDPEGNYYKIRFLSLTKDGERGRPSFEYALVKEG